MFSLSGTNDETAWLGIGDLAFGQESWWWEIRNTGARKDYVYEVAELNAQIEKYLVKNDANEHVRAEKFRRRRRR